MSTVAVIPARKGSKGLPRKHLRLLGGEPLIVHTIRAALAAKRLDRVLVSTDDEAIARVAKRAGAEVPFLRPEGLASDDTPTVPVIRHAVEWLESTGATVTLVVTLQATSPLRGAAEIDRTVSLLDDPAVRSAATVTPLRWPSSVIGRIRDSSFVSLNSAADPVRRQVSDPAVRLTGAVYVTRRSLLSEGLLLDANPTASFVEGASAIDIDTAADLAFARRAFRLMATRPR
jgi:CMP-N-acetylneuraminic acid synthetase